MAIGEVCRQERNPGVWTCSDGSPAHIIVHGPTCQLDILQVQHSVGADAKEPRESLAINDRSGAKPYDGDARANLHLELSAAERIAVACLEVQSNRTAHERCGKVGSELLC